MKIMGNTKQIDTVAEDQVIENDPFYSEENLKVLRKAIQQIKNGEGVVFDPNEAIKKLNLD